MKRLIKTFTLLTAIVLGPAILLGQRTLSGTITDAESGEPLIGANILISGTSSGTITDFDGKYSLEVPNDATQLVVSYTGYSSLTVDITSSDVLDVQLSAGELLEEVVVIGYGTVKREDATGSVQTVSTKSFNRGAITGPQELLSGKIAGVQITNSADAGGGAVIRIRGGSSLSASNDPLIVIDGVPIDNGGVSGSRNPLNVINPNDIETFTVLKDASATAIYGSRASNGVILITTKKGSLGKKIRVNYNGNVGFSDPIANVDVLSGDEFRSLVNTRFPDDHPSKNLLGSANTDWQSEIYQTGVAQDHNLSLSGGVGVIPYRLSLGFTDKKGILKTDRFERTTAALNLSPGFLDNRLQINVNLKGMFTNNTFANQGAIGSAVAFDPTQPVLDPSSPYGGFFTWTQDNGQPNTLSPHNPLALLEMSKNRSDVQRWITNASFDYRFSFLPELRANLNLGYDYSKGEGTIDVPGNASFAFDAGTGGGTKNTYDQTKRNELLEFYLNYVNVFGSAKIDVMGGYSWQRFFFEDSFFNSDIAGIDVTQGENKGELYLLSLFGRLNVTLFDQVLLTATLRRDGTSRFSPDTRWGLFPAAAVAWKMIDGNGSGTLSNLKLRVGYGVTGQQDVGGFYQYLPRYLNGFDNARYQFGNGFVTTIRPEGYDANIKWEETTTYNVGLDYGFLDDRITGSIEYYIRETKDLINFIPVPAGTNLTNFINTNVGDLENRGVEFSINAIPVRKKDISWEIGFNVTANENKITRLTATDDPSYLGVLTGGISGGVGNTIQIHSVGFPANSFLVYEQVYAENGQPIEGLYVDRNGDGQITADDQYRFKKPAPDVFFGLTTNVTYKNFDLSLAGRASIGNYVYNNVQSNNAFYDRLFHPTLYLLNVHSDINEIGFETPEYFSDHFIQDGSFLRLDHITLSYTFNEVFKKSGNLRVYGTLQNPLLISNYTGLDPEVFGGIDSNIYPRSRTILFGVNANF